MFDPENVERFDVDGDSLSGFTQSDSHFVLSSDYDQLLQRHRALEKYLDDNGVQLPQHLWSDRRALSAVASQQDYLYKVASD